MCSGCRGKRGQASSEEKCIVRSTAILVHDCIVSGALARNRSPTHGMPSVYIGYLMHGTLRRQQPPGRVVREMQSLVLSLTQVSRPLSDAAYSFNVAPHTDMAGSRGICVDGGTLKGERTRCAPYAALTNNT